MSQMILKMLVNFPKQLALLKEKELISVSDLAKIVQ